MTSLLLLLDTYEGGFGWVGTTVSEDEARDALALYCFGENGEENYRPKGSAKKVWMQPSPFPDEKLWVKCKAYDPNSIEFWEIFVD